VTPWRELLVCAVMTWALSLVAAVALGVLALACEVLAGPAF